MFGELYADQKSNSPGDAAITIHAGWMKICSLYTKKTAGGCWKKNCDRITDICVAVMYNNVTRAADERLENIAVNTPDIYTDHMPVFAKLLYDTDEKVRMEAPEIFRVLGKRRPEFVRPYMEQLQQLSESDSNRVVRIHCLGAIKAANNSRRNGHG